MVSDSPYVHGVHTTAGDVLRATLFQVRVKGCKPNSKYSLQKQKRSARAFVGAHRCSSSTGHLLNSCYTKYFNTKDRGVSIGKLLQQYRYCPLLSNMQSRKIGSAFYLKREFGKGSAAELSDNIGNSNYKKQQRSTLTSDKKRGPFENVERSEKRVLHKMYTVVRVHHPWIPPTA